jgi:hypothetical protein
MLITTDHNDTGFEVHQAQEHEGSLKRARLGRGGSLGGDAQIGCC